MWRLSVKLNLAKCIRPQLMDAMRYPIHPHPARDMQFWWSMVPNWYCFKNREISKMEDAFFVKEPTTVAKYWKFYFVSFLGNRIIAFSECIRKCNEYEEKQMELGTFQQHLGWVFLIICKFQILVWGKEVLVISSGHRTLHLSLFLFNTLFSKTSPTVNSEISLLRFGIWILRNSTLHCMWMTPT